MKISDATFVNTLSNLEVVTLTNCNHTFTFLKYPMRGLDLAAAPYSTQKSSVLPLYEVSSCLNFCFTKLSDLEV